MTLDRLYPWLIYYGPDLGQPAQVLFGRVTGPAMPPPWGVVLDLRSPDGNRVFINVQTDAAGDFFVDSLVAMDMYFGCNAIGVWQAQAFSQGSSSAPVAWTTAWFPVHVVR